MCKNLETIPIKCKDVAIDVFWTESLGSDWNEYFPEDFGGQEVSVTIEERNCGLAQNRLERRAHNPEAVGAKPTSAPI